jgi:hypothetical protein
MKSNLIKIKFAHEQNPRFLNSSQLKSPSKIETISLFLNGIGLQLGGGRL